METELVELLTKNSENIQAFIEIANLKDPVRQKVVDRFAISLPKVALACNLILKCDNNLGRSDTGFCFYKKEDSRLCILFYFNNNYENVQVGIARKERNFVIDEKIVSEVKSRLAGFGKEINKHDNDYIWYCDYSDWEDSSWGDIAEGRMTEKISSTIEEFVKRLEGIEL